MSEKRRFRRWAFWRRFQYSIGLLVVLSSVGVLTYSQTYYAPPNCFDGILNGEETFEDAGGVCVQIDPTTVTPPSVLWVKSFEVEAGQYNVVAYVENLNQMAATPAQEYTFQLFNQKVMVAERSGVTVLPPNSAYPIFEGRIFTDDQAEVTQTRLVMKPSEDWRPASTGRDQFRSIDIELLGADSRPRLNVEIENTSLNSAQNVEVVATIFNTSGVAVAASQTYIESIAARSTKDITFSWPNPLTRTVESCVIPTDIVLGIDLSGSMNNDGGNPPQPISDALQAASTFAGSLREKDQVGVVTFATDAALTIPLDDSYKTVAQSILTLRISREAETGFTNTVEALRQAQAELASGRHNLDARRVLVLLTDGLPTISGDVDVVSEAETLAQELSAAGVRVYAIGLGQDVDTQFIENIASDRANAYFAPTGADLANIYLEITSSLCEAGEGKIEIIAKTKTDFAPLR
jgi:Mg-chelatase subunit ChlD